VGIAPSILDDMASVWTTPGLVTLLLVRRCQKEVWTTMFRDAPITATSRRVEHVPSPGPERVLTSRYASPYTSRVVMISPNQLKNLRSRYGQAGNKDDRFDAFVLADTLRTDRLRRR
jgi:hypothetical protein